MNLDGSYDHYVLIGLGAQRVSDRTDENGLVIGVEITPDIDISGYAAAVAAKTQQQLIAYANSKQWALATGGYKTQVGDQTIVFATDQDSQSLIMGQFIRLMQSGAPTHINWQVGPTSFVSLAAADFLTAATKVADFVRDSFDKLATILQGISKGTITTTAQIDAAFTTH